MQQITHEVILGMFWRASLKNRANIHHRICNLIKTGNISHYNIKVCHENSTLSFYFVANLSTI